MTQPQADLLSLIAAPPATLALIWLFDWFLGLVESLSSGIGPIEHFEVEP